MEGLKSGRAAVGAEKTGRMLSAMARLNLPPTWYDLSKRRRKTKSAVYSVPAVPITEPIASAERSRRSESGSSTQVERKMIQALGEAKTPVKPASFAIEAKLSPMMIEYDRPAHAHMKMVVASVMKAVFSPKTLAQVSL